MKECLWYATVEYSNPECDFQVILEDTFENLFSRLTDAKLKGFDSYVGSCPNLRVLEVGYDSRKISDRTRFVQKVIKSMEILEGGEDTHSAEVNSVSFVNSLPSNFIIETVALIEGLWTCYDTKEHQDGKDMEASLQKIQDDVWRWKTKFSEELETVHKEKK